MKLKHFLYILQGYDFASTFLFFFSISAVVCLAPNVAKFMTIRNRPSATFKDGLGITYTCQPGYSFAESNAQDRTRTVHCQANGLLQPLRPQECTGKCFSSL